MAKVGYKDFQKKKFKVGKRIAKSNATTDVSIKSARLNLLDQHIAEQVDDTISIKGVTLTTLCSRGQNAMHFKQRKDSFSLISELITSIDASRLTRRWGDVMLAGSMGILDTDRAVRVEAASALTAAIRGCPKSVMPSVAPKLLAHLRVGITHINKKLRVNVLDVLLVLVVAHPSTKPLLGKICSPLVSMAFTPEGIEPKAVDLIHQLLQPTPTPAAPPTPFLGATQPTPMSAATLGGDPDTETPLLALINALPLNSIMTQLRLAQVDGQTVDTDRLVTMAASIMTATLRQHVAVHTIAAMTHAPPHAIPAPLPDVARVVSLCEGLQLGGGARRAVDSMVGVWKKLG